MARGGQARDILKWTPSELTDAAVMPWIYYGPTPARGRACRPATLSLSMSLNRP